MGIEPNKFVKWDIEDLVEQEKSILHKKHLEVQRKIP